MTNERIKVSLDAQYATLAGRTVISSPKGRRLFYRVYFSECGRHALVEKMVPKSATRRGEVRRAHYRAVRNAAEICDALHSALEQEANRFDEIRKLAARS